MGELETYSLTNFIPFSLETYLRLFELWNEELWPVHVPLLLVALASCVASFGRLHRLTGGLAALACLGASAFFGLRYADLVWAGPFFAGAFVVQAVGLAAWGWGLERPWSKDVSAGLALVVVFSAVWPKLSGLEWSSAEVVGLTPDATCLFALVALAGGESKWRWLLMPIPLAWLAISAATWLALGDPGGVVLPVVGFVATIGYSVRRLIW